MNTITFTIWGIFLLVFVISTYAFGPKVPKKDNSDDDPFVTVFFVVILVSIAIGTGIYYDIYGGTLTVDSLIDVYGHPLKNMQVYAISGFVALGLLSVIVFIASSALGGTPTTTPQPGSPRPGMGIMAIMNMIGFISAVLGIIAFYLEWLQ